MIRGFVTPLQCRILETSDKREGGGGSSCFVQRLFKLFDNFREAGFVSLSLISQVSFWPHELNALGSEGNPC